MSAPNWEVIFQQNTIHGIDLADNLNLGGNFCYAISAVAGPSICSIKNLLVDDKADVQVEASVRKTCSDLTPFLFLRSDLVTYQAYIFKLDNNLNMYQVKLDDISSFNSAVPHMSGSTPLDPNVTYKVRISCFTLLDGSAVFECYLFLNGIWHLEIKSIISESLVIPSGSVGFGHHFKFSNLSLGCSKTYFDDIKISLPIQIV